MQLPRSTPRKVVRTWTTDASWTILTMSLFPFWVLNVVVVLLSMEGQKALGFHQKYLNLCSKDERWSYSLGTTWGWVIHDTIFIFGWTNPLNCKTKSIWSLLEKYYLATCAWEVSSGQRLWPSVSINEISDPPPPIIPGAQESRDLRNSQSLIALHFHFSLMKSTMLDNGQKLHLSNGWPAFRSSPSAAPPVLNSLTVSAKAQREHL